MLDLSTCPRCKGPTFLNATTSGAEPARLWLCDRCAGWWRQVRGRDATWVATPYSHLRIEKMGLKE